MKAVIEEGSGFCFGVENAVKIAEESLQAGEKVYCLGEIVHNETEVNRLKKLGLVTIDYEKFLNLNDCKVLVRAHGEPPSTYETARKNNITIIDATCPIVQTLQQRIKRAALTAAGENGQIVIYGKEGHAEVVGLLGAAGGNAILITSEKDLRRIDFSRPVFLFSQTTKSKKEYYHLAGIISEEVEKERITNPGTTLRVYNTICGQVSGREPRLRKFSKEHDVIIFVSGLNSSNGHMLYEVCLSENVRTYYVSSASEIDPSWFLNAKSAGICGATSTPRWLIHEVAGAVEKF
ncbi:MAG TPA: 4-hydroxy-3-methylbut-2-enyl diphosphate reductase [Bacteroidales bacterium]|nr:4-hydroxy-3-methylbut-2-enyl diphosphate reductase [Bacteroidales bacterium]